MSTDENFLTFVNLIQECKKNEVKKRKKKLNAYHCGFDLNTF